MLPEKVTKLLSDFVKAFCREFSSSSFKGAYETDNPSYPYNSQHEYFTEFQKEIVEFAWRKLKEIIVSCKVEPYLDMPTDLKNKLADIVSSTTMSSDPYIQHAASSAGKR